MIDRHDQVSITRQAQLLGISRGSVYCLPRPVSNADLTLMRRIDELHLAHPSIGASMLREPASQPGDHRANQVWALDTTYISMARRFVYLTSVVNVASRRVLSHKVAITLEAVHAKKVIEQALSRYGTP